MTNDLWGTVWERVRSGRHAVIIGPGTLPPAPGDLKVVQVSCDAPSTSGGALDDARRKVVQFLGDEPLSSGPTPGQLEAGLRRRLLGDLPGPALDAMLVEVCNRLAARTNGRAVLVFEAIDAADTTTVETLAQMLRRSGWLRLPLLLTVRGIPQGAVAELISLMRQVHGEATVMDVGVDTPAGVASDTFAWTALSPEVLRVLRAASLCGTTFDADVIARLLNEPLGSVLEQLQGAADAGAPLADRRQGRFSLPPQAIGMLQSRLLPSLLSFWHARLGEILSGERPGGSRAAPAQPEAGMLGGEPSLVSPEPMPVQSDEQVDTPAADLQVPRPLANYAELFEPERRPEPPHQPIQEAASSAAVADSRRQPSARWTTGGTVPTSETPADQARAAAHLQAAGRTEAAVEQYLAAVREVASHGDARRAYSLAMQALQVLDELPTSSRRALLRTQLLLESGRLQWHGALVGAPFTLHEALNSLEAARLSLPHEAPPDLVGQLTATTAGVCYDLGDLDSLQRALVELTEVSRRLLAAGEPLLAARLLNDQAAVYVRLGDPVRATHLLEESRRLFEGRLRTHPDEAVAVEELAETHHLLARLSLHAPIRPGREADAYAISLEHARAAEQAYQRLGQPLPLARVWESMGRLELQRGQPAAAQERLSAALALQQQLGDATGLARSTAAMADVYSRMGRLGEGLTLLANSITLNFEKGSPLGLAVNRRALEGIVQAAAQAQGSEAEQLRNAVAEVERRLVQAESVLGRVELPEEALARS
jgi:tetratricopeptide (TPR) repeat protein